MNSNRQDGVIRITKEEALDSHVDDMLKRQMSLRGDPGVTRERGKRWYYQNWFVFMLVGMMGAFAAWALLEPVFDDYIYIEGTVSAVDREDSPRGGDLSKSFGKITGFTHGSVTLNSQKVYLLRGLRLIMPDGKIDRADSEEIKAGDQIGLYVEYAETADDELALAAFLVRDPPPQSPGRAGLTLEQLSRRSHAAGLVLFAVVAGMVGLFLGAADGLICRLPRRALVCGLVGLLVGCVGGFVCSIAAGIVYTPLNALAMRTSENTGGLSTMAFGIQILGRSVAWALAGLAMGLGQGIALRSSRLLIYGLIGGIIGGLFGGMLFDPINLVLLGGNKPSAYMSRMIGFMVIGATVGGMIGLVELLARDAWLRMTQGPLAGKEFLIFKDVMNIGSSPRSDIYLFNDPQVADTHALLRSLGDVCEIEARNTAFPVLVNSRAVTRARLRHGDTVSIGRTLFVFQQRKT